jgi:hypothetical protein
MYVGAYGFHVIIVFQEEVRWPIQVSVKALSFLSEYMQSFLDRKDQVLYKCEQQWINKIRLDYISLSKCLMFFFLNGLSG